jgi:hypothetical protein
LASRNGPRYNANAIAPDAQTERRSNAGPVRTVLSGYDLTGRLLSPKSQSEISNPKSKPCLSFKAVYDTF